MIPTILGVDIGAARALAPLSEAGDLRAVEDVPILAEGRAGRRTVNAALFADIVRRWSPARAWVELVGARPGECPVGAFAFGHSARAAGGVQGALGVQPP